MPSKTAVIPCYSSSSQVMMVQFSNEQNRCLTEPGEQVEPKSQGFGIPVWDFLNLGFPCGPAPICCRMLCTTRLSQPMGSSKVLAGHLDMDPQQESLKADQLHWNGLFPGTFWSCAHTVLHQGCVSLKVCCPQPDSLTPGDSCPVYEELAPGENASRWC